MPTAIDQLREGVFAQQRAIIDEMERKSGLVLNAYDALMHAIRTEGSVNDKVRAAQAEFDRVCKEVAGV